MSLTLFVSIAIGAEELLLAAASLGAGGYATARFRNEDVVEGTVLLALMVLGAFCLVALDAARRGAEL